jgi:hypothetical protein
VYDLQMVSTGWRFWGEGQELAWDGLVIQHKLGINCVARRAWCLYGLLFGTLRLRSGSSYWCRKVEGSRLDSVLLISCKTAAASITGKAAQYLSG